jgi:hypothetical protein
MPVLMGFMHFAHLVHVLGHRTGAHMAAYMVATCTSWQSKAQRTDRQQPTGRKNCSKPSHEVLLLRIGYIWNLTATGVSSIDRSQFSKDPVVLCVNRY